MLRLLLIVLQFFAIGCATFSGPTRIQRDIVFKTFTDEKSLKADVYYPSTQGPHPGVVVLHGGGWIRRAGRMETICKKLARSGFVAFNATYRLAPKSHYPDPVEDARDAIRFLQKHAAEFDVDRGQISVWGYSAGSHLLLLATLDGKLGVKAIIAGSSPTDLTAWPDSGLVLDFLNVKYKDNPALWREASPVNHVTKNTPPIFLYHGGWDDLVDTDQTHRLEQALAAKEKPYKTYINRWLGHFSMYLLSSEADRQAIDFLKEANTTSEPGRKKVVGIQ